MVLMAKGHRLGLSHPGISDIRRSLNLVRHPTERGNNEDRAKNRGPGQGVRTTMKNLRHAYVRVPENTNETQRILDVLILKWLRRKRNSPQIFSRQLGELGIINISRELVACFARKFVNHVSN